MLGTGTSPPGRASHRGPQLSAGLSSAVTRPVVTCDQHTCPVCTRGCSGHVPAQGTRDTCEGAGARGSASRCPRSEQGVATVAPLVAGQRTEPGYLGPATRARTRLLLSTSSQSSASAI